jgi:hypothetical protein
MESGRGSCRVNSENSFTENDAIPVTFYRPNYHVKTPAMRSPEHVQLSMAVAITLGLTEGRMHRTACTHCLNLLVIYPEGCRANCAYCGLARHWEEMRDLPIAISSAPTGWRCTTSRWSRASKTAMTENNSSVFVFP